MHVSAALTMQMHLYDARGGSGGRDGGGSGGSIGEAASAATGAVSHEQVATPRYLRLLAATNM